MSNDLRSTYWREGLLLLSFLAIVALAVGTVALPELSDAPHPEDGDRDERAATADAGV